MSNSRTDKLTTSELHALNAACVAILHAFKSTPYLVGSVEGGSEGGYRDVDVRLILADDDFRAVCPTRSRWELLCLAITSYLKERTGLPIDFQIQHQDVANEKHKGPRNPLGVNRVFAGGGDGTPSWDEPKRDGSDR